MAMASESGHIVAAYYRRPLLPHAKIFDFILFFYTFRRLIHSSTHHTLTHTHRAMQQQIIFGGFCGIAASTGNFPLSFFFCFVVVCVAVMMLLLFQDTRRRRKKKKKKP